MTLDKLQPSVEEIYHIHRNLFQPGKSPLVMTTCGELHVPPSGDLNKYGTFGPDGFKRNDVEPPIEGGNVLATVKAGITTQAVNRTQLEELYHVLEGQMYIMLVNKDLDVATAVRLNSGDTIRLPKDIQMQIINLGKEDCKFVASVTPAYVREWERKGYKPVKGLADHNITAEVYPGQSVIPLNDDPLANSQVARGYFPRELLEHLKLAPQMLTSAPISLCKECNYITPQNAPIVNKLLTETYQYCSGAKQSYSQLPNQAYEEKLSRFGDARFAKEVYSRGEPYPSAKYTSTDQEIYCSQGSCEMTFTDPAGVVRKVGIDKDTNFIIPRGHSYSLNVTSQEDVVFLSERVHSAGKFDEVQQVEKSSKLTAPRPLPADSAQESRGR